MPETDLEHGQEAAQRIVVAVAKASFLVKHQQVSTTVSVGLAGFPEHGANVQDLLEKADLAMYNSKDKVLSATCETLSMNVDHDLRKATEFEKPVLERIESIFAEQSSFPPPPQAGLTIGIRRKSR